MWRRVHAVKWTDVSDERIASIFTVVKTASEEPAWAGSSPRSRIFLPWRWRRYVPPKRRFIPQHLYGATSQNILHSHRCENLSDTTYKIRFTQKQTCTSSNKCFCNIGENKIFLLKKVNIPYRRVIYYDSLTLHYINTSKYDIFQ
jgi:hypothetical protein